MIDRYKTLELLMKKKKMMAQVEAEHLTNRSISNKNKIVKPFGANTLDAIGELENENDQLFNQSLIGTEENENN